MAMDIEGIDEELRAGPADRLVEIDTELCVGQTIVAGCPPPAARQIAPDLALLLQLERDPELFQFIALSPQETQWIVRARRFLVLSFILFRLVLLRIILLQIVVFRV